MPSIPPLTTIGLPKSPAVTVSTPTTTVKVPLTLADVGLNGGAAGASILPPALPGDTALFKKKPPTTWKRFKRYMNSDIKDLTLTNNKITRGAIKTLKSRQFWIFAPMYAVFAGTIGPGILGLAGVDVAATTFLGKLTGTTAALLHAPVAAAEGTVMLAGHAVNAVVPALTVGSVNTAGIAAMGAGEGTAVGAGIIASAFAVGGAANVAGREIIKSGRIQKVLRAAVGYPYMALRWLVK